MPSTNRRLRRLAGTCAAERTAERYEYLPGRFIVPGDLIRVSRGPRYVLADGTRVPIGHRGTMRLAAIRVEGRSRLVLVCYQPNNGWCHLGTGRPRHPIDSAVEHRPYRIVKVRPKSKPGGT